MKKDDDYLVEQEEEDYDGHNPRVEELNRKLEQYEY